MSNNSPDLAGTEPNNQHEVDLPVRRITVDRTLGVKLRPLPPRGTKETFTVLRTIITLSCITLTGLIIANKTFTGQPFSYIIFWTFPGLLLMSNELLIRQEKFTVIVAITEMSLLISINSFNTQNLRKTAEICPSTPYACEWLMRASWICSWMLEILTFLIVLVLRRRGYWFKLPLAPGGEGRRMTAEEYLQKFTSPQDFNNDVYAWGIIKTFDKPTAPSQETPIQERRSHHHDDPEKQLLLLEIDDDLQGSFELQPSQIRRNWVRWAREKVSDFFNPRDPHATLL